jgi:hypothetical protein
MALFIEKKLNALERILSRKDGELVCLMSDMALSPCLSCLSFLGFEKAIGWIGRLSVDRVSSETHDR